MKKFFTLSTLFLFFFTACEKDDEGINDDESSEFPMEMTFSEYSKVNVDGNISINFSNNNNETRASQSSQDPYSVTINATQEQRRNVDIYNEDGILYILANDDIDLDDEVEIIVYSEDLAEIRLQKDQHAIFEGYFDQENLKVVTEARSILELYNIRVDHLEVKTEGESQVYIDNFNEILEDGIVFESNRVAEFGENLLLIDEDYWVYGDSIDYDEEVDEWTVLGDDIHSVYRMLSLDFKIEGNSYIDAANAPADYVNINLEGDSEAAIWATTEIEGKGEGSSVLHYAEVPELNMTDFILEGSAATVPFYWYEDWNE